MDLITAELEIQLDHELVNIVDLVNRERKKYVRKPCTYDINQWDDNEFLKRLRMSKNTVQHILTEIEDQLKPKTNRNYAISPLQQLLIALRFLATGTFYIAVGDFGAIHKSTVGKIVHRVIYAIARLHQNYIYMPQTPEEKQETTLQFYKLARFPQVLGAIDCTHIRLQSPGGEIAENFRNRKGYFSLNVQVVCNAQNIITDIVSKWPGATHDSYIFNNSNIRMRLETQQMDNLILLADSGYPLRRYLITPLHRPNTASQQLYNESQIRTRNVIERTFGIWKRRFPVLSIGIRTKLKLAQAIITATAVLHNIACKNRDELPMGEEINIEEINVLNEEHLIDNVGVATREAFIAHFQNIL